MTEALASPGRSEFSAEEEKAMRAARRSAGEKNQIDAAIDSDAAVPVRTRDAMRATRDAFRSGDYVPNDYGGYDNKPWNPRK